MPLGARAQQAAQEAFFLLHCLAIFPSWTTMLSKLEGLVQATLVAASWTLTPTVCSLKTEGA